MSINCKGKILNLDSPIVMGILNVTPNSFYDGGKNNTDLAILSHTEQMLVDGAEIIDIGGYSSKPNAPIVSEEEEFNRLHRAIHVIHKEFPEAILSVDTFRSTIAEKCIHLGAAIINDISAGEMDPEMFATIAKYSVPYIIMHMQGTPQTMQNNPSYTNVTKELIHYLSSKIALLHQMGVKDIILDPGFGFGKTIEHNYTLLNELNLFSVLDYPILCGISRKSMIYNTLQTSPENALNGTTALHMAALLHGAKILRVHDVKEAKETITLYNQLTK